MNNTLLDQDRQGYTKEITREFFKNVYAYMFVALLVSGLVAYLTGNPEFYARYFFNAKGTGVNALFYIVAFAPIGMVFLIQKSMDKFSFGTLLIFFIVFSALMGLSLSSVMMVYSGRDIAVTFFVTAGAFGGMAILGYTTQTDLSKMGSLLYMAFIGIFIASIANFFLGSTMLQFAISVIGVFVFTGLTAYSMQQLKAIASNSSISVDQRGKLALMGGLNLYLLFVNLFLSLLNLIGGRD